MAAVNDFCLRVIIGGGMISGRDSQVKFQQSTIGTDSMTLQVIGAGVGRTGTYSLRTAINLLGLGPCHHMREIIFNMPVQLPFWQAAAAGKPDWPAAYEGYNSAVDWPTAASSAN